MQAWQERIVAERDELADKIGKLYNFIESSPVFQALDAEEKERLPRQLSYMRMYQGVLDERIKYWNL